MSPEQARGDKVDHRVDVYAMGCILFQLVSNSVPFQAENFMGVLSQHLTQDPPEIAPEVFDGIGAPRELAAVIDKALVKDRDQRYQTIDEFAAAVREVSGDAPAAERSVSPRPASVPSPGETTRQRNPTGPADAGASQSLSSSASSSRARTPTNRTKTQWTGNLTVPEEAQAEDKKPAKSKLPLILGAVLVAGGAIAAAIIATGAKDKTSGQGSAVATPGSAQVVPQPPPQPPPPQEPPLPVMATIAFDSAPRGAQVVDANDPAQQFGKTPISFALPGSKTPRRFKFILKGYGDAVVELVPNRERIEFKQDLIKGATKPDAVVTRVPDVPAIKPPDAGSAAGTPTTTPGGDMTVAKPDTQAGTTTPKPDTQTGSAAAKPDVKPDTQTGSAKPPDPPKPGPDDDELPTIKPMPTAGSGSGGGAQ
jgi:serine/threonine-protein kinase